MGADVIEGIRELEALWSGCGLSGQEGFGYRGGLSHSDGSHNRDCPGPFSLIASC